MCFKKWTARPQSVCGYFIFYRCVLAALFLAILVTDTTTSSKPQYWFIYLTDLGFLIQTLHLVTSAAVTIQLLLHSKSIL